MHTVKGTEGPANLNQNQYNHGKLELTTEQETNGEQGRDQLMK